MIINPNKAFRNSMQKTEPFAKKIPKSVREAFDIAQVNENGIFQIENKNGIKMYDRVYVFSDINYINQDVAQKQNILLQLIEFFKFMQVDFKITVAQEYRNMAQVITEMFHDINSEEYPQISKGMRQWISQKMQDSNLKDLEKVMYLTITCRTNTPEEALQYFQGLEVQLENIFAAMNSVIFALNGRQRLYSVRKFFYPEEEDNISFHAYKDSLLDVLPTSCEAGFKNFLIFNDSTYVSVLFARRIGASLDEGEVMHTLTNVDYPSFVTLDCAPVEPEKLNAKLNNAALNNDRAIAQELETKSKNNNLGSGISYAKSKKKDEIEGYLEQVDENGESCILCGLLVVISAESEDLLAQRVEAMKDSARKCHLFLDTYNYVQMKAFNTALPFGCRRVDFARAMLTTSLVGFQPFYAQDLMEPGGTFFGINTTTKHLVFGNRKKLPSPHGMIVGHTGSGKSFEIKETEVSQTLLETSDDIHYIDPQNEMKEVCNRFGGSFIDLTPKANININPLEIPDEIWESTSIVKEAYITEQYEWACAFLNAIMTNIAMTAEHKTDIDHCMRRMYERFFTSKKKQQPTLFHLREELKNRMEEIELEIEKNRLLKMYNALELYTDGSYDMFSHETNIDLQNRFLCWGLKNINKEMWEPVMITIMHYLDVRMKYNKSCQRATHLVIDEAQVVAEREGSSSMMLEAAVTYRKFGGICTFALQNLTRVVENPDLRDMFSNCGFKLFFDSGGIDAIALSKIQQLSTTEFRHLSGKGKGFCVMVWNSKIILLDCTMGQDNVLYDVFSTDFYEDKQKQTSEETGIKAFEKVLSPKEENKQKIYKMASVLGLYPEEIANMFLISEKEARELLLEMCSEKRLRSEIIGGSEVFYAIKEEK